MSRYNGTIQIKRECVGERKTDRQREGQVDMEHEICTNIVHISTCPCSALA